MKYLKRYFVRIAKVLSNKNHCGVSEVEDFGKPGENASTTTVFDIREPLLDTSTEL